MQVKLTPHKCTFTIAHMLKTSLIKSASTQKKTSAFFLHFMMLTLAQKRKTDSEFSGVSFGDFCLNLTQL